MLRSSVHYRNISYQPSFECLQYGSLTCPWCCCQLFIQCGVLVLISFLYCLRAFSELLWAKSLSRAWLTYMSSYIIKTMIFQAFLVIKWINPTEKICCSSNVLVCQGGFCCPALLRINTSINSYKYIYLCPFYEYINSPSIYIS